MILTAIVSWPQAHFTQSLVHKALEDAPYHITVLAQPPTVLQNGLQNVLQWSSYDEIDHTLTASHDRAVQSSSYTFRKALIRKHYLASTVNQYLSKRTSSLLQVAVPKTYTFELSFADELDELFSDDLWELKEELADHNKWWILKPGMADRGNGIRLFNSTEALRHILDQFEEGDSDNGDGSETSVIISQLRHFVIQEYLMTPMLIDPNATLKRSDSVSHEPIGFKFHLRAYVLAVGALQVYLFERILALFSSVPYISPDTYSNYLASSDLAAHLTNSSLQIDLGDRGVRLLDELIGCQVLSEPGTFTLEDAVVIKNKMVTILGETFTAALDNPIHFQAVPNAYELFGVDFLVVHEDSSLQVKLLEVNAEPAIELTGPRLSWVLEELFIAIRRICVDPFFNLAPKDKWEVGEEREHLIKCLGVEVYGSKQS